MINSDLFIIDQTEPMSLSLSLVITANRGSTLEMPILNRLSTIRSSPLINAQDTIENGNAVTELDMENNPRLKHTIQLIMPDRWNLNSIFFTRLEIMRHISIEYKGTDLSSPHISSFRLMTQSEKTLDSSVAFDALHTPSVRWTLFRHGSSCRS